MSFFGLTNVDYPYCPICDTAVHADFVFNELRMHGKNVPENEKPVDYKCINCGTEMSIESFGNSFYNVYPDEDTFPEKDYF